MRPADPVERERAALEELAERAPEPQPAGTDASQGATPAAPVVPEELPRCAPSDVASLVRLPLLVVDYARSRKANDPGRFPNPMLGDQAAALGERLSAKVPVRLAPIFFWAGIVADVLAPFLEDAMRARLQAAQKTSPSVPKETPGPSAVGQR